MAQSSSASLSYTIGNFSISSTVSREAARVEGYDFTLPVGIAGEITAVGVDTMTTGHGIVATDIVDVHWDDPSSGDHKCRRGLTVDVDNTDDIEYDETPAGEGDALPAVGTVCVVSVQVTLTTLSVVGNNIVMIAAGSDLKSVIDIRDASASNQVTKFAVDQSWSWIKDVGDTNPFAGNTITIIRCSNGSVTLGTINFAVHYDLP